MSRSSVHPKNNLSRAGWLLVIEFAGLFVSAFAFIKAGVSTDYLLPAAWLFNLLPAWHIAKAARDSGKSALLYGVIAAALPVLAVIAWSKLNSAVLWQRLEQKYGQTDGEA